MSKVFSGADALGGEQNEESNSLEHKASLLSAMVISIWQWIDFFISISLWLTVNSKLYLKYFISGNKYVNIPWDLNNGGNGCSYSAFTCGQDGLNIFSAWMKYSWIMSLNEQFQCTGGRSYLSHPVPTVASIPVWSERACKLLVHVLAKLVPISHLQMDFPCYVRNLRSVVKDWQKATTLIAQ